MRPTVWKMVQENGKKQKKAYAKAAKGERKAQKSAERKVRKRDLVTGQTVRALKESVGLVVSVHGDKSKYGDETKAEKQGKKNKVVSVTSDASHLCAGREIANKDAVIRFHEHYRPYIFKLLERNHGFEWVYGNGQNGQKQQPILRNGTLDAESLYHDILSKLLLGAIDKFDFDQPKVGHGAFRKFLKLITATAYADAVAPELIPVYNPDGTPVLTGQVMKDRHGNPKLDAEGNLIYKQRKERRLSFESEHIQNAIAQGKVGRISGTVDSKEWTFREIDRLRVFFMKCAYLALMDEKARSKVASAGWVFKSMLDIYERGKDENSVREDLISRKVIRDANSFYVAKSRFLDEWKLKAEAYEKKVLAKFGFSSGENAQKPNGRKKSNRKGTYRWVPVVGRETANAYVKRLEREMRSLVGSVRIRMINGIFGGIMARLVLEADEMAAAKQAWRFK